MDKLYLILLVILVVFIALACSYGPILKKSNLVEPESIEYFPHSNEAFSHVYYLDLDQYRGEQDKKLAAISLQGLVNRNKPLVYLDYNLVSWIFKMHKERGYVESVTRVRGVYDLIDRFKSEIKGAIIYDPAKDFTINLATNLAGTENKIIISPSMVNAVKKIGIEKFTDLWGLDLSNSLEAYRWYKKNVFPRQNKQLLAVGRHSTPHDNYRDYLIQFKFPIFWLPGKDDPDYNPKLEQEILKLLKDTPPNIPILGFWPTRKNGKRYGYSEYSGVQAHKKKFEQKKVRNKNFREYSASNKYVALIMIDSNDSIGYIQHNFVNRQWHDPKRGSVPISFGITPSIQQLMPAVLEYFYQTATVNEYFFSSISGAGYCYPLERYAGRTNNPDQVLRNYFELTARVMHSMDLDMMGLYSHPWPAITWSPEDDQLLSRYITPDLGIKSVIADMGRLSGMTAAKANEFITESTTIHHTLTRWNKENDYTPTHEKSKDEEAVHYLVNDIRKHSQEGQFIQAMFYSWEYGPRRLNKVQMILEQEGYEFVTLNEFDYLFRKSKSLNK